MRWWVKLLLGIGMLLVVLSDIGVAVGYIFL